MEEGSLLTDGCTDKIGHTCVFLRDPCSFKHEEWMLCTELNPMVTLGWLKCNSGSHMLCRALSAPLPPPVSGFGYHREEALGRRKESLGRKCRTRTPPAGIAPVDSWCHCLPCPWQTWATDKCSRAGSDDLMQGLYDITRSFFKKRMAKVST